MKNFYLKHINKYRVVVAIGFIIATILTLDFPVKMIGSSPWAYYFGVKNFARGKFVIDDQLYQTQQSEARQMGGILQQYVKINENKWALEKAPGYVFYLVPFEILGIPRWGNIVLALGMVITTFILLKRLRNEKAACIGSLLLLFTPTTLAMLNLAYMDALASLAFAVMGGGFYVLYHLENKGSNKKSSFILLFLAFLLIAWSAVTRYTNITIALVFAMHFIITRVRHFIKHTQSLKSITLELSAVITGTVLPLTVLLVYNYLVFGSPLDYGYNYTRFPIKFAFEYMGQIDVNGNSLPLEIILDNLKKAPAALITGFPVLSVGIPAFILLLVQKSSSLFSKDISTVEKWYILKNSLNWDLFVILIGWFIAVFFLYITYEFTAEYLGQNSSFIRFARFYLPGIFPVVIISSIFLERLPGKTTFSLAFLLIIISTAIYLQYITGQSIFSSGNDSSPKTDLQNKRELKDNSIPERYHQIQDSPTIQNQVIE